MRWLLGVLLAVSLALTVAGVSRWPGPEGRVGTEPDPSGLDEAWSVVVAQPRSALAWAALGDAQAAAEEAAGAEHAYRTALRLAAPEPSTFARLGFLLYARGQDQEALALLSEAKRRGVELPMLDHTIEQLERHQAKVEVPRPSPPVAPLAGPPPPPPDGGVSLDASVPSGSMEAPPVVEAPLRQPTPEAERAPELEPCEIPARRRHGRGTFLVPVRVAGVETELILDTGATITLLSRELVARAGLITEPDRAIKAITANGRVELETAVVPMIEIGPLRLEGARVAVCEDCMESVAAGLLGLDLQSAFDLRLDLAGGRVFIERCD